MRVHQRHLPHDMAGSATTAEAEQAFGRVVALGIAYNELGVKFLFNPGSDRILVRPEDQRRLRHVAAPDRAGGDRGEGAA